MQNLPNHIRRLRLAKQLTLQQLAEAVGTSKGQIDKLEKGGRRLTVEWMIRIGRALACDPRALLQLDFISDDKDETAALATILPLQQSTPDDMGPAANMAPALPTGQILQTIDDTKNKHQNVPISVSRLEAAFLPVLHYSAQDSQKGYQLSLQPVDYVPRAPCVQFTKDAYAFYMTGEEMSPMFRPRQLLYVNPFKPPVIGCGVVALRTDGSAQVYEYVASKKGSIVLRWYKPVSQEIVMKKTELHALHYIVGMQEPL